MQINNVNYSALSNIVNHINNPNLQTGTLIEEIPADIGRSIEGYKRGGILEGAEKLRKELMSAAVWLFGIPIFNKSGNLICEKFLNIPMNIDYSNAKKGNDAIKDTLQYIKDGVIEGTKDISEIQKYAKNQAIKDKINALGIDAMAKKVAGAKQITSITAVIINCIMMGIALPKFNQKLTQKELEKQKKKKQENATLIKPKGIDVFQKQTKQPVFKGNTEQVLDRITYNTENSNRFRLIITDIPMIIGRCITSRNKYEALEYIIMDGASIYFYNFSSAHIQKALRKLTKTPDINSKIAEFIGSLSKEKIEDAIDTIKNSKPEQKLNLETLFKDKETADSIYDIGTFGKHNKINRFVKKADLETIDSNVVDFIKRLETMSIESKKELFKDGKINREFLSKINKANAGFLGAGLLLSIIGLAVIIPKMTFLITQKLTGKNVFTGIEDYDNNKKNTASDKNSL